jgi:F5/8 type C domain
MPSRIPSPSQSQPGLARSRLRPWTLFWLLALAALACSLPLPQPSPTAAPLLPPTEPLPTASPLPASPVASPTAGPVPDHRIGIRVVDGVGEFYDRMTGEKFVPRGNNYNEIKPVLDPIYGSTELDVTLSTGYYDRVAARQDLQRMHDLGYNLVRIMPETCAASGCITAQHTKIRPDYIANMVDFLKLAKEYGIYVWISSNTLPDVGYYLNRSYTAINDTWDGGNIAFLHPLGVAVYKEYFHDLITALIQGGAPLDAIFSYELRNEQAYDGWLPPLTLKSGLVTTANGQTYDMSQPDDKLHMMNEGLVYWVDQMTQTIHELDPTALVSIGFFPPNDPHAWMAPDDLRLVHSHDVIWNSTADFFDVHPWPGGLTFPEYVDNFGFAGMEEKPIVMGEMTAFKQLGFDTPVAAAQALHDWQIKSCDYGVDGWLVWTWNAFAQTDLWPATAGNGEIAQVLAPNARPDPCQPGTFDFFETNLALGKPVRASRSLPDQPAENAVDGTYDQWGSGSGPPQWIEIDLGQPSDIRAIRLVVAQYPAGDTVHQILGRGASGDFQLLHEFRGPTAEAQTLEFRPDQPLTGIQVIRINTLESPSWVSWHEIEVIAK